MPSFEYEDYDRRFSFMFESDTVLFEPEVWIMNLEEVLGYAPAFNTNYRLSFFELHRTDQWRIRTERLVLEDNNIYANGRRRIVASVPGVYSKIYLDFDPGWFSFVGVYVSAEGVQQVLLGII